MQRRMAVIMAADVVGYSRLMGKDEAGTFTALKAIRNDLFAPRVAEHHGRIVKVMGDGVLVDFASVVNAVACAVEVQQELAERNAGSPKDRRIELRIGMNFGDVIIEGGDLYGDGVNVAARLQELAAPGGICISGDVYRHVSGRIAAQFHDLGEQELKNIADRVRVYQVRPDPARLTPEMYETLTGERLELPSQPSVAVLPFQNMSSDPEQEFFADGMTEDIIAVLSRASNLVVMARNSTFVYKGSAVDVRQVGRDLGVGYVVEGSIRKAGLGIRVTAQLIDAQTGGHIWAQRYDRNLDDVFAIQDEITREIVVALSVKLTHGEEFRIWSTRATSFEVWESLSRALMEQYKFTKEGNAEAKRVAREAIARDPNLPFPRIMLGFALVIGVRFGFTKQFDAAMDEAESLARDLLAEDAELADAHTLLGYILVNRKDFDAAVAAGERAIELEPNVAQNHAALAMSLRYSGQYQACLQRIKKALRLSPYCPDWYLACLGDAYHGLGDLQQARLVYEHLRQRAPDSLLTQPRLACIYAELGDTEKAAEAADKVLSIDPAFSVRAYAERMPAKQQEDRDSLISGLLEAGLPE